MQRIFEVLLQYDWHVHGVLRPASQNNWCPFQAADFFRDGHRQPRISRVLLTQTTLFSEVRAPEMWQLGKTGFWTMSMGLLQEPYCASPMVLKRIHVSDSLTYQKRIIKKKKETNNENPPKNQPKKNPKQTKKGKGLGFFTLERKSQGLQIKLHKITVVLHEMCAELINQVKKINGQEYAVKLQENFHFKLKQQVANF